ncbi:MAG: endonuclease/exonuclease/phosphatase family protein [Candidatus Saccharibacteria bacterium]|nr:endonuclease/exonuclease/phosphatase family protein [Rhodoferax sp.]
MRIVSWNCNGALRNKVAQLDALDADLLIIQECEDPALASADYRKWAGAYLWKGSNKHKGIGVFPKKGNTVCALDWYRSFSLTGIASAGAATTWTTNDLELFLPFKLNGKETILSVWTKGDDSRVFSYIGQLWKYLCVHQSDLSTPKTLIVGDFNSNTIWDKTDRWWNHSDVVRQLASLGLNSLYHIKTASAHGKEATPTLYLQRNRDKPYHVDYAFASADILPKCDIQIGRADEWLDSSDHMPLTLNINSEIRRTNAATPTNHPNFSPVR